MSQTKTIRYPSGVVLTRNFDNETETWEIDNKALSTADFTVDISNCQNVSFQDDGGSDRKTITIQSQEKDVIRIVKTIPYKFAASFSLSETPIPYEDQKAVLEQFKDEWNDKVESSERIFKQIPYEVLSQQEIVSKMNQQGATNFIDPHFPPRDTSLYNVVQDQYPFDFVVHWRRPHEFMDHPVVFENDVDPNDIKQGQLGDCWFLSALSSLAERPGMVKRLFITKDYNKEGIYKIKICKNGEWVTVTIDDYIPCRYNGGPMFSRGAGSELWVMLMEKAYAKLHGSYQALSAGFTKHAMIDLTGCPTEHVPFPKWTGDYEDVEEEAEEIFAKLLEADEEGHLISTETGGVDTITEGDGPGAGGGLVSGHAYSIIQVKEGLGVKLLNIRNPWGQFEWDGDWADNDEMWTEEMVEEFNPHFDENDGSFWICLEDFMAKFEACNLCRIENFNEARFKGKFIKTVRKETKEEFAVSKFFYTFEVEEENDVTIGIHQEDERIQGAHLRRNMDVGFVILRVDEDEGTVEFHDYLKFSREREAFKRLTLEEGRYAVVPLTSGALMQRSLQASTDRIPPKFTFDDTVWPHPYFASTISDIFRKLDLAVNGMLSAQELNQFGRIIGEQFFLDIRQSDFNSEAYNDVSCNEEGVTLLGFKQLLFRNYDDDEIRRMLDRLGYDEALNSHKSRAFMMSFQAHEPLEIQIKDILEGNYHTTAWEQLMSHLFEEEGPGDNSTENDDYTLFAYSHEGSYSASYACINHTDDPLKVTLDLSKSQSVLFQPSSGVIQNVVPPNTLKYLGSLACDPDATSYGYSYRCKTSVVEEDSDEE